MDKSKKKLKSKKKVFSLKKSSSVKLPKRRLPQDRHHLLMMPESFLVSKIDSQEHFIFRGDSGYYQNNRWNFKEVDTQYIVNPINYQVSIIYPNYQRLYWNGNNFINLNNQPELDIPTWLSTLLPEEFKLDLFLDKPTNSSNWPQVKLFLFDLVIGSDRLSSRTDKLNFILENCQLQWKITNFPEKGVDSDHFECPIRLLETKRVTNMHQAYYLYKQSLLDESAYLLLRRPDSLYESRKSYNLLTWKPPLTV